MAKKLNDDYLNNEDLYVDEPYEEIYNGPQNDAMGNTARPSGAGKKVWNGLRPVVVFAVALFVVALGVRYVINTVQEDYFDPVDVNDSAPVEVTIPKGASLSTISELLYENEIVKNKTIFKFYADFTDMGNKLKSGTYELSKDMTFDDIIYVLMKGMNTSPTNDVMLLEGLVAEDFAEALVKGEILKGTDEYLRLCKTADGLQIANDELKSVIADDNAASEKRKYVLEGYLFPDTYQFYRDGDPADVISKQLNRFNEIYSSVYWQQEDELGMTTDEIVILASIIEKESQEHDFKKVSAVLHNRLQREMPLQCDTTIAYGLDIENRINLTDNELAAESPYNTHLRTGLPIGPICNPSRAAIEAALYPDEEYMEEGYLYFTLLNPEPDEDGRLHLAFTKTFEEHQAIVDEYKPLWEEYDREQAASE